MTPEQRAELRIRAEIPGIWGSKVVNDLLDDITTLTRERDEARAEVERLRAIADSPVLLDSLAENAHVSWAGWTKWMLAKWNDTHSSGERFPDRWARQIATTYDLLSEQEKDSDREEARQIIVIIRQALAATEEKA